MGIMKMECKTIERCLNWWSSLLHQGDLVLVLVCLTACPPAHLSVRLSACLSPSL